MAWYPKAARKNIPPGPNDPPIKARVVILHVAATETTSLFNYFSSGSGGVESHFYVRYDGSVEQYRDTAIQADANVMANDFAISIETQGLADGTWTDAQLDTIKALLTWCHDTHGIPLVVCPKWDGSGVGYHILFEDQWDQRHASCPGPNRIKQFNDVLVPWMAAGGSEDDVSPEDIQKVADVVWTKDQTKKGTIGGADSNESPLDILTRVARNVEAVAALTKVQADQVAAAVVAAQVAAKQPTVDVDALARAIVVQLTKGA